MFLNLHKLFIFENWQFIFRSRTLKLSAKRDIHPFTLGILLRSVHTFIEHVLGLGDIKHCV